MVQTQLDQSGRELKSMSSRNTEFVGGAADYISFAAFVDSECSGFSFELNNELNHILAKFNEKIYIQNALARAMVRVQVQLTILFFTKLSLAGCQCSKPLKRIKIALLRLL